jgi:hypothetical protein
VKDFSIPALASQAQHEHKLGVFFLTPNFHWAILSGPAFISRDTRKSSHLKSPDTAEQPAVSNPPGNLDRHKGGGTGELCEQILMYLT